MDEKPSADGLPPRAANDPPGKRTRDTRAVPTDLAPGESREYPEIPGYEILGICGHGGMGVVYRARQRGANRPVALKMIRAVEHATPTERLRFQIETEAVARLQHPHIVQLYEVGEVRGLPFFSLELCDGGTLTEQLKQQRPTPRASAQLIETLARAMHYAHLRGVVHRDLKPGNVLLAGTERVAKITDFGLAKRIDAEARDVSQSGAIMGTAAYMAPEQAAGKVRDTGPAADVYALGALLYECLTGRPPFVGPQHEVLLSVLSEEPVPPSRRSAQVPADLETICLKCLSKEPARRYASAEELANDLRRFQAGEPIRARPVGRLERVIKWVKRNPVVAGATLAALLAVTLGTTVSYLKYLDADQQKRIAEEQRNFAQEKEKEVREEAEKARKARDFLASMFRLSEPRFEGGEVNARRVLEAAEQRIPDEFVDQPEFREALLADIRRLRLGAAGSTPYAMLLEVRGTIALQSASGTKKQAIPQTLLHGGDRLSLGANAQAQLVFLSDLHKERLKPASEVTVRRKGCEPADAILERDSSILMTFVRMPRGAFYMGGGQGEAGKKLENKEEFEIAIHDVTQGQWEAVMGTNPSHFSRKGNGRTAVLDISDEELKLFPVEMVSWTDALAFIRKLNEKERGRGYSYRLPTEGEWEYACRGGAVSEEECSYHFYFDKPTNDLSSEQANFDGNHPFGMAPKGRFLQRPTRVGAYPSNKLGLCDMHGNVWQWCADEFLPEGSDRVYRGGGWRTGGSNCRAAFRLGYAATGRDSDLGFRLARVSVQ